MLHSKGVSFSIKWVSVVIMTLIAAISMVTANANEGSQRIAQVGADARKNTTTTVSSEKKPDRPITAGDDPSDELLRQLKQQFDLLKNGSTPVVNVERKSSQGVQTPGHATSPAEVKRVISWKIAEEFVNVIFRSEPWDLEIIYQMKYRNKILTSTERDFSPEELTRAVYDENTIGGRFALEARKYEGRNVASPFVTMQVLRQMRIDPKGFEQWYNGRYQLFINPEVFPSVLSQYKSVRESELRFLDPVTGKKLTKDEWLATDKTGELDRRFEASKVYDLLSTFRRFVQDGSNRDISQLGYRLAPGKAGSDSYPIYLDSLILGRNCDYLTNAGNPIHHVSMYFYPSTLCDDQ
jgi:hypothetical protein